MKFLNSISVSDVLMVVVIIGQVAMFFWVKPLREAKEQVDQLKSKVADLNLDRLRAEFQAALDEQLDSVIRREYCIQHMNNTDAAVAQIQSDRRESVNKLHTKIDAMAKDLHTRVDSVVATLNKGFQDLERSIGRIEGKVG